ncbi:MAG TPA: hypothetical protein VM802_14245 [Chitinophaga sp.]|nr:hypothetical protein [Chitinophaga sp.]HVI46032.1 hypothetical protein [Chitinophaga sp.]
MAFQQRQSNEIRIGYACMLLKDTNKGVIEDSDYYNKLSGRKKETC